MFKGTVYNDINGNLIQDAGESSLPGVQVTLNPGGQTFYTDINGNYCAILSDYITYTVGVNLPNTFVYCPSFAFVPYTLYFPTTTTYTFTSTIGNSVSTGNDFMLQSPADSCGEVQGHVWRDANQDGTQNGTELDYSFKIVDVGNYWGWADVNGDYAIQAPKNVSLTVEPRLSWWYNEQVSHPAGGSYNVTLTNSTPGFNRK